MVAVVLDSNSQQRNQDILIQQRVMCGWKAYERKYQDN